MSLTAELDQLVAENIRHDLITRGQSRVVHVPDGQPDGNQIVKHCRRLARATAKELGWTITTHAARPPQGGITLWAVVTASTPEHQRRLHADGRQRLLDELDTAIQDILPGPSR